MESRAIRCIFLKVSLLPIIKVLGQNDQLQNNFIQKSDVMKMVSEFAIWALKKSKIALHKKVDFWSGGFFSWAPPLGNPSKQLCQPKENPVLPDSFYSDLHDISNMFLYWPY